MSRFISKILSSQPERLVQASLSPQTSTASRLRRAGLMTAMLLTLPVMFVPMPARAVTEVSNQIKRPVAKPSAPVSETLTKDGELQPVLSLLSAQEAARLVQDAGFAKPEIDPDGDLVVEMQGFKVLLLVGSNKGEWLLLKFAVTDSELDLPALNAWNRQIKYSRAYLDDANVVILESDQDLSGGVTPKRLKEFLRSFDESLRLFSKQFVKVQELSG